jgi:hypothetical protein
MESRGYENRGVDKTITKEDDNSSSLRPDFPKPPSGAAFRHRLRLWDRRMERRAVSEFAGPTISESGSASQNSGSGMLPEVRQRIFEPFFTTKEISGTGLGMWVVSELMRKQSGRVSVSSSVAATHYVSLFFPATTTPDSANFSTSSQ